MTSRVQIAKNQGLNWQAIVIEEAQTDIKVVIKNAIMLRSGFTTYQNIKAKINRIIAQAVKELESEDLKRNTATTLARFAERLYGESIIALGVPASALLLVVGYLKGGANFQNVIQEFKTTIATEISEKTGKALDIGQAKQMYNKEYMEEVKPALQKIIESEPMYDTHVSLRNIAEMTVRYDNTLKEIDNLVKKGVNLVVSSKHANCSKRCEPWQGGHYTLDNTYQFVDGIQFQPLKNATDQFYTTRKGKVYKNGHITGYNCRHYLMEYRKGYEQPEVSAEVVERERAIDHRMRAMERVIRKWKDAELIYKGEDREAYLKAKAKANLYYERYKEFAKENKRAYYPSRTDVF